MMLNFSKLPSNAYIHMVGIGGISMSALAHMLKFFGYKVSGSDRSETEITKRLNAADIKTHIGHSGENVCDPDLVCYTAAIPKDNPELVKARSLGIPVMERAELLGELMKLYKFPIAIAGTHGKTTTTSMLSLVLLQANLDPTILVGGELPQIGGNYKIGEKEYLVFEACEYVESFLHFSPYLSIITNVDEDHLDYFTDIYHIITAFERFVKRILPSGCIIVCYDDKNAQTVVQNVDKKVVKYGTFSKNNDFFADGIRINENGKTEMKVYVHGEYVTTLELSVHGRHNALNALGAFAAAWELGIPLKAIKAGLESFGGTKRRFEEKGLVSGIRIIDDYAHHPTEIKSSLETAKQLTGGKVWCIFQPHTFSRTKALLKDFGEALTLSDKVVIADIYPAREIDDGTVHARDLTALVDGAVYLDSFEKIRDYVLQNAIPGDMVITMGAGDIYKVGEALLKTDK